MNYIRNRKKYIIESYIENINESKLFLSPELRKYLKKIDDDISKELLNLEFEDSGKDLSFLDVSKNDKLLSFSRTDKLDFPIRKPIDDLTEKELNVLWNLTKNSSRPWGIRKNQRIDVKIGKIINKLFPGKFKDSEIEVFVNKLKGIQSQNDVQFKLVSGDDIIKYYQCDINDNGDGDDGGELGRSCMQNEPRSYFEIYSKNPGVCRLLILVDGDDLLVGRALVWRIDEILNYDDVKTGELDFEFFMDRTYTTEEKYEHLFYEYCKKEGWARRAGKSTLAFSDVYYNNRVYYGLQIKVQLNYIPFKFPYMDTFKDLDPTEAVLYNFDTEMSDNLWLEETDGGFFTPSGKMFVEIGSRKGDFVDANEVYEYDRKNIHKDDIIYNHRDGEAILKENAVYCIIYTDQLNEITAHEYLDKNRSGILKINEISDTLWYKIIKNNWENNSTDNIYGLHHKTTIFYKKDFKGNYILNTDVIVTRQAENGEWYLSTEMELFNTKVSKPEKNRVESRMEYYYRVWHNATWDGKSIDNLNPKNIKHNMVKDYFRLNQDQKAKYDQYDKYIKNMSK